MPYFIALSLACLPVYLHTDSSYILGISAGLQLAPLVYFNLAQKTSGKSSQIDNRESAMGETSELVCEGYLCEICWVAMPFDAPGAPRRCSDCRTINWTVLETPAWLVKPNQFVYSFLDL